MTHQHILWIAVAAYGIHALEEHELNWKDWARTVLRLPVDWPTFYVVNFLVVVLGTCCAAVGWNEAWFSLGFPALMIINATFFHVVPMIVERIYSPGVATAVALLYPVAAWTYYGAWRDNVLSPANILLSFLFGAALMATPIILLKVKGKRMFTFSDKEEI